MYTIADTLKYVNVYSDTYIIRGGEAMQVGKLKTENNKLLEHHEDYGFSNKTKMMDYALDLLREKVKKEKRRSDRKEMLNHYAQSSPQNYFAEIEGEDFE